MVIRRCAWILPCLIALTSEPAGAQTDVPAWATGADTEVAVVFPVNDPSDTGIVLDTLAVLQWGNRLDIIARPVSRGSVSGDWRHDLYQLGVRYHRPGGLPVRLEIGYALSVVGLGVLESRPGERETSFLDPQYVRPLPPFDTSRPPVWSLTPSYPLVAIAAFGNTRWDARAGVADGSPTRMRGVLRANPPRAPQLVVGGGITPVTGLRLGTTFVRGNYLTSDEVPEAPGGRLATVVALELEYEVGRTAIAAEVVRDGFEVSTGHAVAASGFVHVTHALSPHWRIAARYDHARPPSESHAFSSRIASLTSVEAAFAYRFARDLAVRGFVTADRAFYQTPWTGRAGFSLVLAQRWW